jgi:hypothetical protein
MSYSRITNLLPSRNTLKASAYTGAFILVHLAAWWDREIDKADDPLITISLVSKIIASAHTFAVGMEVWEDLSMVSLNPNLNKYKLAAASMLLVSTSTLVGTLAAADSAANMILGVANANSNFAGRLFSGAHRKAVMSEQMIDFDRLERGVPYNTLAPSP